MIHILLKLYTAIGKQSLKTGFTAHNRKKSKGFVKVINGLIKPNPVIMQFRLEGGITVFTRHRVRKMCSSPLGGKLEPRKSIRGKRRQKRRLNRITPV